MSVRANICLRPSRHHKRSIPALIIARQISARAHRQVKTSQEEPSPQAALTTSTVTIQVSEWEAVTGGHRFRGEGICSRPPTTPQSQFALRRFAFVFYAPGRYTPEGYFHFPPWDVIALRPRLKACVIPPTGVSAVARRVKRIN